MTEVSLEKSTAINLIRFKLFSLRREIDKILQNWSEELAQTFLEKARDGTYEEAENDAIDLRQMIKEEKELQLLLKDIGVSK